MGEKLTEYWWLIERPGTDGAPLYLAMIPGINQTTFQPNPWKATRFRKQSDAEEHVTVFYRPGFGVRAVEHAFDTASREALSHKGT